MIKILDGKKLAGEITEELKEKVASLKEKGITPKLVIFQIGDNPASDVYVNMKKKKAEEIGAICQVEKYDDIDQKRLIRMIAECDHNDDVHGILVQLPLPAGYDEDKIVNAIDFPKDVDGLTNINQVKILNSDSSGFLPATPRGIITLLERNNIEIEGEDVVVVGRSKLVGKTLALELLNKNATVTICHSKTRDLADITKSADILISAVGVPNLITKDHVKEGAVVIDVGINRTDEGLVGDVDFEQIKDVAGYITPVPGGVGPMTVVSLYENLVEAASK